MKQIKITNYYFNAGTYSVCLGNSTKHNFTSKKQLDKFLSKTSKFLTTNLHTLNLLYSDTFSHYRKSWIYFEHNRKSMNSQIYSNNRKCISSLNSVNESFERIMFVVGSENYNHFAFKFLYDIIYDLQSVIILLRTMHRVRCNTSEIHQLDYVLKNLSIVKVDLDNYGMNSASEIYSDPLERQDSCSVKFSVGRTA